MADTRKKTRKSGKNKRRQTLCLRNTRKQGKQVISDRLVDKLKPTESDVQKMLAAQVHIGRRRAHVNMKRYVWKRRQDGCHIINLEKTWNKIQLAARIIVAVKNPADVVVMSTRTYGQRGAIKFAQYTKCTSMVGKWVPGTFCNPQNKAYCEPRLLFVDDPSTCFAALRETSYVGIPVIAFSGVDNNSRFVDCVVPSNNRGKLSIGLMFWLLAREVLRMRGEIRRDEEWGESVDLFFYRDPDEIKKQQEAKAQQQKQEAAAPVYEKSRPQEEPKQEYDIADTYGADYENQGMNEWDAPPDSGLADWGDEDQVQGTMDYQMPQGMAFSDMNTMQQW